jgi:uncharacterized protein
MTAARSLIGNLMRVVVAMALLSCCGVASAQKLAPIPTLSVRVNDNASLLTQDQHDALETDLSDYQADKDVQIVVLTIASTSPEPIDQYGARLMDRWKVGRKDADNALLIVFARDNPPELGRLRIEIGHGIDSSITDVETGRIIDEEMRPHLGVLDYNGGLVAGINRLKSLIAGEPMPPPPEPPPPPPPPPRFDIRRIALYGAPGLVASLVLVWLLRRLTSRRLGYLSGNRALNRSFNPMLVGGKIGKLTALNADEGNGFGGGYVGGGASGFAGGGGDFGGGGASGDW